MSPYFCLQPKKWPNQAMKWPNQAMNSEMSIVSSTSRTCYQSSSMDTFSLTMYRQKLALVVTASLSGWRTEEVGVECRNRKVILLLGGGGGWSSSSGFTKSLCSLPANVDVGLIITEFDNGMLTLTLPKMTSYKQRPSKMIASPARHAVARDHVGSPCRCPGRFFRQITR